MNVILSPLKGLSTTFEALMNVSLLTFVIFVITHALQLPAKCNTKAVSNCLEI